MAIETKNPFPKRLREARLNRCFTQEQLGLAAGMSEEVASARMNQYEKGVHHPDFQWIARIASELGYPTAYFFAVEDDLAEMISGYKSTEDGSDTPK